MAAEAVIIAEEVSASYIEGVGLLDTAKAARALVAQIAKPRSATQPPQDAEDVAGTVSNSRAQLERNKEKQTKAQTNTFSLHV